MDNHKSGEPGVIDQNWQYNSGQLTDNQNLDSKEAVKKSNTTPKSGLNWSASEFLSHEKNGGWYMLLIIGTVILAAIIFYITKEILSVIAILVLGVATGVYGALKPRVLEYSISDHGITIGDKNYNFTQFKSFSLIEGSAMPSIQLLPQKKFAVPVSIFVSPEDIDLVINTLGNYLPFEKKQRDFVDKLSSRLRF